MTRPSAQDARSTVSPARIDPAAVQARQEDRFGGMRFGSAFFGWLTAAGITAILGAVLAATGVGLSLAGDTTVQDAANQAQQATGAARTIGLVGGIALLVVLFLAYVAGGYVAGRMARFNGVKQGVAVWIWGIVVAVVVAIAAAVFGSRYNVLTSLNLPRLPIDEGTLGTAGIIALVAIVVVTLLGGIVGGAAGMRYHRAIDRAGLSA
ncbi:hypothetical protein [Nakamurella deserti]|uniref:hypothetical protein n=1 Tax=Nakamurella deserti TaxID=2164074 RepID=UPI000DBE868B|nr:hypothetical protein [Nakamurella deserti]